VFVVTGVVRELGLATDEVLLKVLT